MKYNIYNLNEIYQNETIYNSWYRFYFYYTRDPLGQIKYKFWIAT